MPSNIVKKIVGWGIVAFGMWGAWIISKPIRIAIKVGIYILIFSFAISIVGCSINLSYKFLKNTSIPKSIQSTLDEKEVERKRVETEKILKEEEYRCKILEEEQKKILQGMTHEIEKEKLAQIERIELAKIAKEKEESLEQEKTKREQIIQERKQLELQIATLKPIVIEPTQEASKGKGNRDSKMGVGAVLENKNNKEPFHDTAWEQEQKPVQEVILCCRDQGYGSGIYRKKWIDNYISSHPEVKIKIKMYTLLNSVELLNEKKLGFTKDDLMNGYCYLVTNDRVVSWGQFSGEVVRTSITRNPTYAKLNPSRLKTAKDFSKRN